MTVHAPGNSIRRAYGAGGITALVLLVVWTIATYRGAFDDTVAVNLRADRSGLIMEPGAAVQIRGVDVGKVASVDPDDKGGALLRLNLDRDLAGDIPADVTGAVTATTVFGPKTVSLLVPARAGSGRLQAGAEIPAAAVSTEVNDVFQHLYELLTGVDVAKLNGALTATATALDGRGGLLGDVVGETRDYLQALNAAMPAIKSDITSAADVTTTYAGQVDELVRVMRSSTVTSETLVDNRDLLHQVLAGLTDSATEGERFVRQVGPPLITAVDALHPVAELLAEYAPELTCTIEGLDLTRIAVNHIFGEQSPTLAGSAGLLPGQQPYQPGRDLPRLVRGLGPDCYQLPRVNEADLPLPRYIFEDGTRGVYAGPDDTVTPVLPPVTLYDSLFGTGGLR